MFKNYLKTTIRNLLRYKGFAFINILSLPIGVPGADVFNIAGLPFRNFLFLVLIASLATLPVAPWPINNWLKDFPYRTSISWWIFGIAIIAALATALVRFQSIKKAVVNPLKLLRTE